MKLARVSNQMFQIALQKLISQPLPLRAAFKLRGVAAKVKEEYAKFEEVRRAALEKYGTKDEEGKLVLENNNVKLSPENLEAFAKELSDLGLTDIEVSSLKLSELGDKAELSADEVELLSDIVVDG